jgi:hypothetical protein
MAGVPETLRAGSCLSQHVNLPYMQEGEQEMIVEGHHSSVLSLKFA